MEKTKTATIIPFEEAAYKEHVVEAEIVVHGSREKPYYEIKYRKAGEANLQYWVFVLQSRYSI